MRSLLVILGMFVSLLLLSPATIVMAQGGAGITLKPATLDEAIELGTSQTHTVTVRNESNIDQTFYLSKRDITGVRDGNVPIFAVENIETTGFELSQWITIATDSIFVPAGQEVPIQYTVNAPANATPGSHFAGIFVSVDAPEIRESGAAVGYEVAHIVVMRVAGDVIEKAEIRQLSTNNYIYSSQNVEFNVHIQNNGSTLIRPTGPLEINNMFGQKVGTVLFNTDAAGVFPGTSREFVLEWVGSDTRFGRYEAVLSAVYGEEGSKQTMTSTVTFWILPMNIIGPALGVLAVLFLIIYVATKMYVRRQLAYYQATAGRRVVRRGKNSGNPFLMMFLVMMTVTAVFFLILLVLFS